MDDFLSSEILAVIVMVSINMPKNVIRVDGLTTFSGINTTANLDYIV